MGKTATMRSHVESLVEEHGISVRHESSEWDLAWAEPESNTISVPTLKVRTLSQYLTVLHEIAHCVFQHSGETWDEAALNEVHANVAAFHWSKFPVPASIRRRFDEDRILHSSESP